MHADDDNDNNNDNDDPSDNTIALFLVRNET